MDNVVDNIQHRHTHTHRRTLNSKGPSIAMTMTTITDDDDDDDVCFYTVCIIENRRAFVTLFLDFADVSNHCIWQ